MQRWLGSTRLQHLDDQRRELHSGWMAARVGASAVTGFNACVDAGGGGGSMRLLCTWGPKRRARVPFQK
eukprot:197572-Pyramimonas_sp.AAC.1